jgi:hypothetical protein
MTFSTEVEPPVFTTPESSAAAPELPDADAVPLAGALLFEAPQPTRATASAATTKTAKTTATGRLKPAVLGLAVFKLTVLEPTVFFITFYSFYFANPDCT